MDTIDATAAKNRFGHLLEACARAPVAVERHGRVVAYVVGPALMPAARPLEERLADCLRVPALSTQRFSDRLRAVRRAPKATSMSLSASDG